MRSSCAGPQAFHLRLSQIGRGRFRPVAREQRTFSVFAASRFHFSLASILLNGCGFPSYVAERGRLQCTRRKSPAGRIRRTFTGCVSCSACFHPTHARTHARTPALSHPCTHILTCSLARAHTCCYARQECVGMPVSFLQCGRVVQRPRFDVPCVVGPHKRAYPN